VQRLFLINGQQGLDRRRIDRQRRGCRGSCRECRSIQSAGVAELLLEDAAAVHGVAVLLGEARAE
jgi:hypothetical protein